MALVFYARVSSKDQNLARQLARAKEVKADKIFCDKKSGKSLDRPAFKEMMNYLREGDILEVLSLDRLSRNYADLKSVIAELHKKGVKFISDDLPEMNTNNPLLNDVMMDMFVSLLGFVSQNEREKIRERQKQGIELAKKRGVYKGRIIKYGPNSKNAKDRFIWEQVVKMLKSKQYAISDIARQTGLSRTQVYRIKNRLEYDYKKQTRAIFSLFFHLL